MINLILSYLNFIYKIKYVLKHKIKVSKDSKVHYWKIRFNNYSNVHFKIGKKSYVASDINFEKNNINFIVGNNTFISGAKFSIAKKSKLGIMFK